MSIRSSSFQPSSVDPSESNFPNTEQVARERSIGEIISQANNLSPDQIQEILAYQKANGVRFGEAAVALGLANSDDVLWALAQQFHYPYATEGTSQLPAELVIATKPFSEQAEAFRTMRSHMIMRLYSDNGPRSALAVVSPDSGDGKTYFAANLAAAFSQLSGRTLLIDADLRNPRLHEIFSLQGKTIGLSSILSGRAAGNVICPVKELPSLYVMPAGPKPPNPLELLERPAFGMLIRELLTKFDQVIVDTPAASQGSDSAVIAARCGAAVAIARQHKSRMYALQDLINTISMGPIKLVGSVLNEF
ncbi:MAG: polysaccharide biosynthesis tyrosine autokinase [Aquabacterium sp.]|jgi:protein-tyrosine kinase